MRMLRMKEVSTSSQHASEDLTGAISPLFSSGGPKGKVANAVLRVYSKALGESRRIRST